MEECFFYVGSDANGNEGDGVIHAVCLSCRMREPEKFPGAWYYTGHFGPWTVSCYNCGEVIHQHEESDETSSEEASSTV